mmetsp:Transcript_47132/g.118709  ORF Transcript_47132/g.118709 Transcript_47132/m.118709 type:complete len:206 (-) Transcript_47132:441-1058(-)
MLQQRPSTQPQLTTPCMCVCGGSATNSILALVNEDKLPCSGGVPPVSRIPRNAVGAVHLPRELPVLPDGGRRPRALFLAECKGMLLPAGIALGGRRRCGRGGRCDRLGGGWCGGHEQARLGAPQRGHGGKVGLLQLLPLPLLVPSLLQKLSRLGPLLTVLLLLERIFLRLLQLLLPQLGCALFLDVLFPLPDLLQGFLWFPRHFD